MGERKIAKSKATGKATAKLMARVGNTITTTTNNNNSNRAAAATAAAAATDSEHSQ